MQAQPEARLDGGNYGKLAFQARPILRHKSSSVVVGKTITMVAQSDYDHRGFEG
jgi:hypothetical protein